MCSVAVKSHMRFASSPLCSSFPRQRDAFFPHILLNVAILETFFLAAWETSDCGRLVHFPCPVGGFSSSPSLRRCINWVKGPLTLTGAEGLNGAVDLFHITGQD